MKWTPEQTATLKKLCLEGKSNSEIATILNCHASDVYAKRSQLGITIDKVKAAQQQATVKTAPDKKPNPHMKVKIAFKALHTALLDAGSSKVTTEGQALVYSATDDLLGTLETLVFKAIQV